MVNTDSYDLLATAIILLDGQARVGYANTAAEELFGLSRRQLAGVSGISLFGADPLFESRFPDAVQGRYGVLRQDIEVKRGLSDIAASLVLVPLDAQPWSALLEVRAVDQHQQLDRAQQTGKELAALRESLRNLAHEIRNPLGGIRGAAQLLDAQLRAGSLREYTCVIVTEVDRLSALVDRLVAPQAGALNKSRFNIHEICERVHTLVHAEYTPQIELVRDYDASVPELEGDPDRLVQALLNIVRNGAQALIEGGSIGAPPRLVLRTRIGRGLVPAGRPAKMAVVVSVIDNGPGVQQVLRDRIFHPLVTGRAHGTGLGLCLAQEFAQQHDGIVEFDSRAGHTEFRLILPLESV